LSLLSPYTKIKLVVVFTSIGSALLGFGFGVFLIVQFGIPKPWSFLTAFFSLVVCVIIGTMISVRIQERIRKKYGLNT